MIFESLSEKLQKTLDGLRGKGRLSEKDVDAVLREVKLALLEADVNYKVVKNFINTLKERAIGTEVMESLTPGQQVIKIVNEELINLMGKTKEGLNLSKNPSIILMCGLQGAGKTTTTGKLAVNLRKKGRSMGEKMDELEEFHPDRIVSKILGMGDVLTLIEKAQSNIDQKKAMELEKKLREETFTLDDFLDQIAQMRNLGPIENLMQMIPGMNSKALKGINISDKDIGRVEAIIRSMTMKERVSPNIINASRKKRIAEGSGTTTNDVNKLLKQFEDTKKMMKRFGKMEKSMKRKGNFNFPFNI